MRPTEIFSMNPTPRHKLYTYNLTQIPGSKWGLTRGRKGESGGTLSGRGRRGRSGGFLRSRQTKYNSASYKERSRRDEGSLSLFPSLPLPFLLSFFLLSFASSSLGRRRDGGEDEPSWSMNGLRRAVFIHSLLGGLETHKKCISRSGPSP